jgi:hypothetical protein
MNNLTQSGRGKKKEEYNRKLATCIVTCPRCDYHFFPKEDELKPKRKYKNL